MEDGWFYGGELENWAAEGAFFKEMALRFLVIAWAVCYNALPVDCQMWGSWFIVTIHLVLNVAIMLFGYLFAGGIAPAGVFDCELSLL